MVIWLLFHRDIYDFLWTSVRFYIFQYDLVKYIYWINIFIILDSYAIVYDNIKNVYCVRSLYFMGVFATFLLGNIVIFSVFFFNYFEILFKKFDLLLIIYSFNVIIKGIKLLKLRINSIV